MAFRVLSFVLGFVYHYIESATKQHGWLDNGAAIDCFNRPSLQIRVSYCVSDVEFTALQGFTAVKEAFRKPCSLPVKEEH